MHKYQAGQLVRLAGRHPSVRVSVAPNAVGLVLALLKQEPWGSEQMYRVLVEGKKVNVVEGEIAEVVQ